MSGSYWQDTFNPIRGCSHAGSPGCDHCWARDMHKRFRSEPFEQVTLLPEVLSKPLHRRKPTTYFVCNTSDLYHPSVPFEFIAAVYGVMAACPQHTFLTCTKRPERRAEFMEWLLKHPHAGITPFLTEAGRAKPQPPARDLGDVVFPIAARTMRLQHSKPFSECRCGWCSAMKPHDNKALAWPLDNVWEGVTVCTQAEMDRVVKVINPNYRWWISLEPALEHVDLKCPGCSGTVNDHMGGDQGGCSGAFPSQVIIGGESGPGARPCELEWIRSLVRQARNASVPCFVKQLGSNPVLPCPSTVIQHHVVLGPCFRGLQGW